MKCKSSGCESPAISGGEYCGEHGWLENRLDPNAIGTTANTEQGRQRVAPKSPAVTPHIQQIPTATNTDDD